MKKFFTTVACAIMVGLSAFSAINWGSGKFDNLAKGSTVTVSSKDAEAANITDDNNGTGWQAAANTHEYTQDWVLIDLGAEKTFNNLEIIWEASHCKQSLVSTKNI